MPSDLFRPQNAGSSTTSSFPALLNTVLSFFRQSEPAPRRRSLTKPYRVRNSYLPTRLILPAALCSVSFIGFLILCHVVSHQTHDLVATPSSEAAKHSSAPSVPAWLPNLGELRNTIRPSVKSLSSFGAPARMSDHDRLDLIDGLDILLDDLPYNWPAEHWCTARNETLVQLTNLRDCLIARTCRKNQASVIIGGSYHFGNSIGGHTSGEDIWARSSTESFRSLGHTVLYAYQPLEILAIHDAIGAHIPIIIMEGEDISQCVQLGVPRLLTPEEVANKDAYHTCTPAELERLREKHGLERPEGLEVRRDGREVDELGAIVYFGWTRVKGDEELSPYRMGCVKRDGFEEGIPIWKMFAFHFWTGSAHPLGNQWTLSPEDYRDAKGDPADQNTYLGYSIETACKSQTFTHPSDRIDRTFVYGKTPEYLSESNFAFHDGDKTFADMKAKIGMDFVVAMGNQDDVILPDKGLSNIGSQTKDAFYQAVGRSTVMLGLGRPWLSPTPYDSLCMGTPFINPIIEFDAADPTDRTKWTSQQDALRYVPEPYVYHVHKGDLKGLEAAIVKARQNPLADRYIVPWMTEKATRRRHWDLVGADWKKRGEKRMEALRAESLAEGGSVADAWGIFSVLA